MTSSGAGDRKPGADGKLPPVGNTVDVAERDLDEHDRRPRTDRRLEGPGLRPGAARLLLRRVHRDPDAALDRLRREALRHQAAAQRSADDHQERAYTSPIWYTP